MARRHNRRNFGIFQGFRSRVDPAGRFGTMRPSSTVRMRPNVPGIRRRRFRR